MCMGKNAERRVFADYGLLELARNHLWPISTPGPLNSENQSEIAVLILLIS